MILEVHADVLPEIVPGVAGEVITVTDRVLAALAPQALFAVTPMIPPVLPAFGVTVVDVGEIFLTVHPVGNVQV